MSKQPVRPERARQIVETILAMLDEKYVLPDRVPEISARVRALWNAHEPPDDLDALCRELTVDLRESSGDRHMLVRYTERPLVLGTAEEPSDKEMEEERREARLDGGGVHRVERLAGNVGYIEIRDFYPPRHHADVVPAAMELIAGTDALIFDLRRNRGGWPETVAIWMGYLFEEPTHLLDIEWRYLERRDAFWSPAYVPGELYLDRPIYVLTSSRTVSGGESFAYCLANRDKATLIGETTRGAAHGRILFAAEEHIAVHIPAGYPSDPLTGTNWEGIGVSPHIERPASEALDCAYALALRAVAERTTGADGPEARVHREAVETLHRLS